MPSDSSASLPYLEPPIETLLVLSSFIILLNTVNGVVDKWLYCGLVGQILVGIAWGTPGAQLLALDTEKTIVELGYIGLILLVFEGGLSTNISSLRANFILSASVASTGVTVPIALSFVLAPLTGATHLQCFAAGAALCSTSLGTTLAVLRSSGLASTRLGVVLTTAAMLDDVAGLVMVQIISNLGAETSHVSALSILRPLLVSVAFAVLTIVACRFLLIPLRKLLMRPNSWMLTAVQYKSSPLVSYVVFLVAIVAASSYAGTSNLFGAYIAGAVISWWATLDSSQHKPDLSQIQAENAELTPIDRIRNTPTKPQPLQAANESNSPNGLLRTSLHIVTFDHYFHPALEWVLQPFFFASVGFSIPITRMFTAKVVWKGTVYAILMIFGKVVCGLWLIRFPRSISRIWPLSRKPPPRPSQERMTTSANDDARLQPEEESQSSPEATANLTAAPSTNSTPNPRKSLSLSLYPASIVGLAMVPRGEIGFLISSVADSGGIFDSETSTTDIFLVVTWAVVLCTILGPLCVGTLVRRVRRLGRESCDTHLRRDVLGIWGC